MSKKKDVFTIATIIVATLVLAFIARTPQINATTTTTSTTLEKTILTPQQQAQLQRLEQTTKLCGDKICGPSESLTCPQDCPKLSPESIRNSRFLLTMFIIIAIGILTFKKK